MRLLYCLVALSFTGLLYIAACGVTYPALVAHKQSCVAQGLDIKAESESEGLPCWAVQARLQHHVDTSPDCRAYWGDAGVDLRCSDAGH